MLKYSGVPMVTTNMPTKLPRFFVPPIKYISKINRDTSTELMDQAVHEEKFSVHWPHQFHDDPH